MVVKHGSLIDARTQFKWAATFAGSSVFIGLQANDFLLAGVAGGLAYGSVYCLYEGVCEVARYIKPEEVADKNALPTPQHNQP